MSRTIEGIGFIKGSTYKTVRVAGMGVALGDIETESLHVKGAFNGKKVRTGEVFVEGIARGRISVCSCTEIFSIMGKGIIQKIKEDRIVYKGEGMIKADTVSVHNFRLIGICRMNKLEAEEVYIMKDNKKDNYINKNISTVGEIACRKLVAYDLKGKKITAQEVELHGNCEIDTLICETVRCFGLGCVIKNHIKRNMFDLEEERDV